MAAMAASQKAAMAAMRLQIQDQVVVAGPLMEAVLNRAVMAVMVGPAMPWCIGRSER